MLRDLVEDGQEVI